MRRGPRTLRRGVIVGAAVLLVLSLGATMPALAGMRGRMLRLVNHARTTRGERPLDLSLAVSDDAKHHSAEMARRNVLFHTKSVPAILGNRPWSVWGENIAEDTSVRGTFRAWMGSPEHRANILNPRFRHIGIGIVAKGRWLWSTADFWG